MKIAEKETVQVVYLGNKAVVKGYEPDKTDGWLWFFPIFFGAIGAAFWLALAWGIVKTTGEFIIKQTGTEGTGIYVRHEQRAVDDAVTCNIYYTFENRLRETVEAKTGFIYRDFEAEVFAKMGTFPVKYIGNKAIIMVDKKVLEKK
jgi:hypothetical protein